MKSMYIERILNGWLVTPINSEKKNEARRSFDRLEDVLTIVKNHFS